MMSDMVSSPFTTSDPQVYPAQSTQVPLRVRRRTQSDQDKEDDRAQKEAERHLEKSWMDRLQLISVITTFFASAEAQLLGITTPNASSPSHGAQQAANASLSGALVFHAFAAILSFTAAFVLIQFRVKEAERGKDASPRSAEEKQEIWSRNPHVAMERVGYRREPPMHLLHRFHILCISMAAIGFILAAAGILCYVWAWQARSVSVFSTVSFAVCFVAASVVFLASTPEIK